MDSAVQSDTGRLWLGRSSGAPNDVIALGGSGHVLTIAPSAAGRARACVVPNLLTYPGSVVVIDPLGEAYAATARARRAMGQTVVRLDPFRVTDEPTDALDPFDLVRGPDGAVRDSACQELAGLFAGTVPSGVWESAALGLLAGVFGYLAKVPEKKFADVYATFHSDDVVYNLAVVLDTIGKQIPKMAYSEIASFLQKVDAERSWCVSVVTSQLKPLATQEVQAAFGPANFSLAQFAAGAPVTVYATVPPAKAGTHGALLRVWVGALLCAALGRSSRPAVPTLFLLDDTARLGPFAPLEAALETGDRFGLRAWTFWQDVQQLRTAYPASWLLANCGAVQALGVRDYSASAELAAVLGTDADTVRKLGADEVLLCRDGAPAAARQLNYLTDPEFAGRFEARPPLPRA